MWENWAPGRTEARACPLPPPAMATPASWGWTQSLPSESGGPTLKPSLEAGPRACFLSLRAHTVGQAVDSWCGFAVALTRQSH